MSDDSPQYKRDVAASMFKQAAKLVADAQSLLYETRAVDGHEPPVTGGEVDEVCRALSYVGVLTFVGVDAPRALQAHSVVMRMWDEILRRRHPSTDPSK